MNGVEAKTPSVQLYHFWSSVCSVRCRMALEEKGVAWESKYIDLFKFDQLTPDYLAINPDGVVPTLVHNGSVVRESVIINEYIDAAFPGPRLIPADPLAAAQDATVHPNLRNRVGAGRSPHLRQIHPAEAAKPLERRRASRRRPTSGRPNSCAISIRAASAARSRRTS